LNSRNPEACCELNPFRQGCPICPDPTNPRCDPFPCTGSVDDDPRCPVDCSANTHDSRCPANCDSNPGDARCQKLVDECADNKSINNQLFSPDCENSQRIEDVLQTAKIVAGSTISSVFPSAIMMKAGWI